MKDIFFAFWVWVFWVLVFTAVVLAACFAVGLWAGLCCRVIYFGWHVAWSVF